LAKSSRLWSELSPDLQTFVTDVPPFHPGIRYPGEPPYETLVNSATPTQWKAWLADGRRLVDFIEQK